MKHEDRLRNAELKHAKLLNNMVDFKMIDTKNVNSLIKKMENITLRELIMSMETKDGEKVCLAIEKSQEGKCTL